MGIQRKNIKMYKKLITLLIIAVAVSSIHTVFCCSGPGCDKRTKCSRDLGEAPKKMAKDAPVKEVGKGSAKPAPKPVLKKAADVKVKPVGGAGSTPPPAKPQLKPVKAAPAKKVGGKGSLPPAKKPKANAPLKAQLKKRNLGER